MKSCYFCRKEKDDVCRRLGLDARGQTALDVYLCDFCAEQLSHFGPYAKVLKRSALTLEFLPIKDPELFKA